MADVKDADAFMLRKFLDCVSPPLALRAGVGKSWCMVQVLETGDRSMSQLVSSHL